MKLAVAMMFTTSVFATTVQAGSGASAGNRLVLATYWGDDRVALLDTQGEAGKEEIWAVDVLKLAGCAKPYDVRAAKDGEKAYVSCSGSNKVAIIDIVAQQARSSDTIETGSSPRDLQLYDNDRKLIVANSGSDTVSVINVELREKLYDFNVSVQPYGVAVVDNGSTALVTGWASGDLHIVELGDKSAGATTKIEVGLLPYTVIAPGDGRTAYVASNGTHSVVAVDIEQKRVVNRTRVGRNPWSLAASLDGQSLLVTNNRSNSLSLMKTGSAPSPAFSLVSNEFSGGFQLQPSGDNTARAPKNASVSSDGNTGVFTDLANNQVVVVDLPSGNIRKVINAGKAPYGIEFLK